MGDSDKHSSLLPKGQKLICCISEEKVIEVSTSLIVAKLISITMLSITVQLSVAIETLMLCVVMVNVVAPSS